MVYSYLNAVSFERDWVLVEHEGGMVEAVLWDFDEQRELYHRIFRSKKELHRDEKWRQYQNRSRHRYEAPAVKSLPPCEFEERHRPLLFQMLRKFPTVLRGDSGFASLALLLAGAVWAGFLSPLLAPLCGGAEPYRAPVVTLTWCDGIRPALIQLADTLIAFESPVSENRDWKLRAPNFIQGNPVANHIRDHAFVRFQCDDEATIQFEPSYVNRAVVLDSRYFRVPDIERFLALNSSCSAVVLLHKQKKLSLDGIIAAKDATPFLYWPEAFPSHMIKAACCRFEARASAKDFGKKEIRALWERADVLLGRWQQRSTKPTLPPAQRSALQQMLTALLAFLECLQQEELLRPEQCDLLSGEWCQQLFPGSVMLSPSQQPPLARRLILDDADLVEAFQTFLARLYHEIEHTHLYTADNGFFPNQDPDDPTQTYWAYLATLRQRERGAAKCLVFREAVLRDLFSKHGARHLGHHFSWYRVIAAVRRSAWGQSALLRDPGDKNGRYKPRLKQDLVTAKSEYAIAVRYESLQKLLRNADFAKAIQPLCEPPGSLYESNVPLDDFV